VDLLGLLAGDQGQPHYCVLVDPHQAVGLTDAATLLQMLEYGEGFIVSELAMVQGRTLALGEAFLTGAAGEDTTFLVGSIAEANSKIVQTAAAVVGTLRILAAEGFEVVHHGSSRSQAREKVAKQLKVA
jgi:hypothetical protein